MNSGVNGEGRSVDRVLPFYNFAVVIDQNQVGGANLPEVHTERVDPKMIEAFGVAGGDVAGNPFIESKSRKQPKGARQALLAILALLRQSGKRWWSGQVERVLGSHSHERLQQIRQSCKSTIT